MSFSALFFSLQKLRLPGWMWIMYQSTHIQIHKYFPPSCTTVPKCTHSKYITQRHRHKDTDTNTYIHTHTYIHNGKATRPTWCLWIPPSHSTHQIFLHCSVTIILIPVKHKYIYYFAFLECVNVSVCAWVNVNMYICACERVTQWNHFFNFLI